MRLVLYGISIKRWKRFLRFFAKKVTSLSVDLFKIFCETSSTAHKVGLKGRGQEKDIFIFGRNGKKIIFYDLLEEEFGTSSLDGSDEFLTEYELNGDLDLALTALKGLAV